MAKVLVAKSSRSNLAKIRKHFQETGGSDSGINWFNIKAPSRGEEAKEQIRVLPPWSKRAEGFFYHTESQHFGFSIGGRNRAITCSESLDKGNCLICKFISRLKNSGEKDHDKLSVRLRGNRRYFCNIVDRSDSEKIKIFGTNKKFIETVLDASDDPDIGDITDPKTGHDIVMVRRGSGFNTRYTYRIRVKPSLVEFDRSKMYQLDKDVTQLLDHNALVQVLQNNFAEELKEVGLKLKPVAIKKKSKVEDEDESDNEDNDNEDEDTEITEESEEDTTEEEDEEENEESEEDDENKEDSDEEEEDEDE